MGIVSAESTRWKACCDRGARAFRDGRLELAEQYHWEAVQEARQFGEPDPRLAASLNNLAVVLRTRGEFQKLEDLYNLAVRIWKAVDPGHVCLAMTLNNAGRFYQGAGDLNQARALYRRALEMYESRPEPEDYLLASCLSNLGRIHCLQARLAQSESCYKRALAIAERLLGQDHPGVGLVLSGSGALYTRLGRFSRAEGNLLRARELLQRARGPAHPDVATCLVHLADLYRAQAEAATDLALAPSRTSQSIEPLYCRALAIRETALRADHPEVAQVLRRLGSLYRWAGKVDAAEQAYRRALKILLDTFGPYHHGVVGCLEDSAELLRSQGRYSEATGLDDRASALRQRLAARGSSQVPMLED